MVFYQKEIRLLPYKRSYHIITDIVLRSIPELKIIEVGILTVFIKYSSASLTINENADSTVRMDFESHMNVFVPENAPYYKHILEGPDDTTAHLKASLLWASVQIPITNGKPNMDLWQGIYLCEHRNNASGRNLVVTVYGAITA